MKFDIRIGLKQRRPLALGFLNPVFAEDTLPCRDQRRNTLRRMGLGNCDKRDVVRIAPCDLRSVGNAPKNVIERSGWSIHGALL